MTSFGDSGNFQGRSFDCAGPSSRDRLRSATVCFVKALVSPGAGEKRVMGKMESDKTVPIFPTTPATTAAGQINLFLKAGPTSGVGESAIAASPRELWR